MAVPERSSCGAGSNWGRAESRLGQTAAPRDEIDRDTYGLFDLEKGVPTDSYDLKDAVADGFLVPAQPVSVPLKFQRQGIKYDDLSEEEKEQWDAQEWDD